ncbi:MAG TPA: hypothetical protein EYN18_08220 [Nitrospirales bacterium]|nr:hypothetical protein [Nitrospirales bacterium]
MATGFGIVVPNHDLTGIVVGVTAAGAARDSRRYDSGLRRRGGQATLLSTCNRASIAAVEHVVDTASGQ